MVAAIAPILERRQHILRLQRAMAGRADAQGPEAYVTRHHFAPGQYAREILLPEGSLVVGKIHMEQHINVLSHGRALVATPGAAPELLSAPYTFVSQPGTKRVVLALTDVVWTTVHSVGDERDLGKIEQMLIATSFEELEQRHAARTMVASGRIRGALRSLRLWARSFCGRYDRPSGAAQFPSKSDARAT